MSQPRIYALLPLFPKSAMRVNTGARILVWILVGLVVLLLGMTWSLTLFADSGLVKDLVMTVASETLSAPVTLARLTIQILPAPSIHVQHLTIHDPSTEAPVIRILDFDGRIDLASLLRGELIMDSIAVDHPSVTLRRNAQGAWMLPLSLGEAPSGGANVYAVSGIRRLRMENGTVMLEDEAWPGEHERLSISDIALDLQHFGPSPWTYDLRVSARLITPRSEGALALRGHLNERSVHNGESAVEGEGNKVSALQFHGEIRTTHLDLSAVLKSLASMPLPPTWHAMATLRSSLDLVPGPSGLMLAFSDITGQINDIALTGKGHLDGIMTTDPGMLATISLMPCRIQQLRALIPDTVWSSEVQHILAQHPFDGELERVDVTWSGLLSDPEQHMFQGFLRLRDGSFVIDPELPVLADIQGSVRFDSQHLLIEHLEARYGQSHLETDHALLKLQADAPHLAMTARSRLAAEDVVKTLKTVPVPTAIQSVVKTVDTADGQFHVEFELTGPMNDPQALALPKWDLTVEDLKVRLQDIDVPFGARSGHLQADGPRILIHDVAGWIGDSTVDVSGTLRLDDHVFVETSALRGVLTAETLEALWAERVGKDGLFYGPMEWAASVTGPLAAPTIEGRVDLSALAVQIEGLLEKPAGVPAWLTIPDARYQDGALALHQGILEIPPFQIEADGRMSLQDPLTLTLTVRTPTESAHIVPEGLVLGHPAFTPDILDLNLFITGQGKEWTAWDIHGFIGLRGIPASTAPDEFQSPYELSLNWMQTERHIDLRLRMTDLPATALFALAEAPEPPLTGLVTMHGSLGIPFQNGSPVMRSLAGQGGLQVTQGRIFHVPLITKVLGILNLPHVLAGKVDVLSDGMPFESLTATWSLTDGVLETRDVILKSPVLHATAAGTFDVPSRQVNGIVAVSPFGAYTNLLKQLPLFGTLFRGERKGLATALFEVKGPIAEPDVRYLPLQSITEGLASIVTLPLDLLMNIIPREQLLDSPQHDQPASAGQP
ncbi:MAG: DUF3971 domain-containing protein [Nitrospirae bacterium]|nr:MAG: DUF3971 domain-containing protein [Nitrospirota bacterium]